MVGDCLTKHYFSLKAHPLLPAPLHVAWGLLNAKGVSLSEKLSALRFVAKAKLKSFKLKTDISVSALLQNHQQSPTFIKYLWEPLCLAALNTPLEQASAQIFLNVLRDSFARKKSDADALLPKTDLSSLISTPLAEHLGKNGAEIKTNAKVTSISPVKNGYQLTIDNQLQTFSHVILAGGPHQLKQFTNTLPKLSDAISHFTYQPITTVYLQYPPETRLKNPMTGAVNSLSQWIFDRGLICNQDGLIAVVISAHRPFEQSKEEVAEQVQAELAQLFPNLGNPLWHKVITEKRATFSCDVHLIRPDNQTTYPNLMLAGDYTKRDYPATIEGAVRSGIKAAKLLNI